MLFVGMFIADVVGVVLTVIVPVTAADVTLMVDALQLARLGNPEQLMVTGPVNPAIGVTVKE